MKPNIRVEIQNNLVDTMETEENEEGEISDDAIEMEAPKKNLPEKVCFFHTLLSFTTIYCFSAREIIATF